jgi:hypothetical protein
MRNIITSFIVAIALASCASVPAERVLTGRVYNLATGEVVPIVARANPSGRSMLTAGPTKSGETFTGEGVAVDNTVRTNSYGGGTISTPGSLHDTYVRNSSYSVSRPGSQSGSAILVGTQGTVIDIVYRASVDGSSEGEGRDNKGVNYRIIF